MAENWTAWRVGQEKWRETEGRLRLDDKFVKRRRTWRPLFFFFFFQTSSCPSAQSICVRPITILPPRPRVCCHRSAAFMNFNISLFPSFISPSSSSSLFLLISVAFFPPFCLPLGLRFPLIVHRRRPSPPPSSSVGGPPHRQGGKDVTAALLRNPVGAKVFRTRRGNPTNNGMHKTLKNKYKSICIRMRERKRGGKWKKKKSKESERTRKNSSIHPSSWRSSEWITNPKRSQANQVEMNTRQEQRQKHSAFIRRPIQAFTLPAINRHKNDRRTHTKIGKGKRETKILQPKIETSTLLRVSLDTKII